MLQTTSNIRGKCFRWVFADGRDGGGGLPSGGNGGGGGDGGGGGGGGLEAGVITELRGRSKYSPLLWRILAARGKITSGDFTDVNSGDGVIEGILHQSLNDLHEAAKLPGVSEAAQRLVEAVKKRERIVIYGDYDVDGITATAILYHALKAADGDAKVRSYVPHRLNEGYGLNIEALDQIAGEGADLVVSVDCGISAVAAAAHAKAIGLELIITDHHNMPGEEIADFPEAAILVHPRLPGSEYPWGELCGAGVAFKLAWQFAISWCGSERVSKSFRNILVQLLSFAALGTIADVVPLQDENRIIVKFGLKMMRHTDFAGLNALIDVSGLGDEEKMDSEDVGFRLAPRLNAAGRMGHAAEAVRLFTEAKGEEAMRIASDLNRKNAQRQGVERAIMEEAVELAEEAGMTKPDCRIIILAKEEWHPGVVGIVCSRLVQKFGRPVILMNREEDIFKGSGRSIDGYSIYEGLRSVSQYLTTWGGHDMAAGLSLAPKYFDEFVHGLTGHANAHISVEELTPMLRIDAEASLGELSMATVTGLRELGPFGRCNPQPRILVRGLRMQTPPRGIGSEGKHLSLQVVDPKGSERMMRLVGWGMGYLVKELAAGQIVDVVMRPKLNRWQGRTTIEGEICDLV